MQGSIDDGPTHDRKVTALVDDVASLIPAEHDLAARLYTIRSVMQRM